MTRFIDPLCVNSFLDANILDDVADGEDAAVTEIVGLAQSGEIMLLLPYSVQNELENPNTPAHVRRVATLFPFSMGVPPTDEDRRRYRRLIDTVKGDAEENNIAADLFHVWEAAKYGGYFITRDKRLLARSKAIASVLQVEVVTPMVFLGCVGEARKRTAKYGQR